MAGTNFLGVGSGLPFDQWLADERKGITQNSILICRSKPPIKGRFLRGALFPAR